MSISRRGPSDRAIRALGDRQASDRGELVTPIALGFTFSIMGLAYPGALTRVRCVRAVDAAPSPSAISHAAGDRRESFAMAVVLTPIVATKKLPFKVHQSREKGENLSKRGGTKTLHASKLPARHALWIESIGRAGG
jgi:hypothetical protein